MKRTHFYETLLYFLSIALLHSSGEGAPSQKTCVVNFDNEKSGQISSPNFPSAYKKNDFCLWSFNNIKESEVVVITFDAFMLEPNANCFKSYVEIGTKNNTIGNEGRDQQGEKMCGKRDPFTVKLTNPGGFVHFQSDSESGYPGFHASFQVQSKSTDHPTAGSLDPQSSTASSPSNGSCQCGQSSRQAKRIVGGSASDINEYPWLVVLVMKESPNSAHCGGALITPKHVATAAHCTNHRVATDYLAIVGAHDIMRRDQTSTVIKVTDIHRHKSYNVNNEYNDIAIMVLEREVPLSQAVQTICLAPPGKLFTGETAVAAGWGKVEYGGNNSDVPLEVRMPVVDNKECQERFSSTRAIITEKNICAGVLNGEKDACQGDSGGPLMWQDTSTDTWYLIGIVSYGVKCATPGFYGVYTRVSQYTDWIEDVTKQKICIN